MSAKPSAMPDGRSKRRPGVDEQRQIITHAAVELFCEEGVRNTSIAQICARADVSRPTFYRCFEDKNALVASIYDEAVDAHTGTLLLRGNLQDPEELRGQIDDMLDAIFARSQLARLVFVEASDPNSPAAAIVERSFEQAANALRRDLKRRRGAAPSKVYLKSVMAAVQWTVHDAIRKGLTPRARAEARTAVHALVINALGHA